MQAFKLCQSGEILRFSREQDQAEGPLSKIDDPNFQVFAGNLPSTTTERKLREKFSGAGKITRVKRAGQNFV